MDEDKRVKELDDAINCGDGPDYDEVEYTDAPDEGIITGRPTCGEAEFIALLGRYRGVKAQVARALGISRQAVDKRIRKNKRINAAYNQILEACIDVAEAALFDNIINGEFAAQKFYLETKGKERGYVKRSEISGPNGQPLAARAELSASLQESVNRIIGGIVAQAEESKKKATE